MTIDEIFQAICKLLPECEFGTDLDGQIVIYTAHKYAEDGSIEPVADSFVPNEEE